MNFEEYNKDDEYIVWLFDIIRDWNEEMRANLLFFITGIFNYSLNNIKKMQ
jgi:hypothetical protein